MQWKVPSSPSSKITKGTPSSGKVVLSSFWDCVGIIMTNYHRRPLLKFAHKIAVQVSEKRRGKFSNVLLLLHDNAAMNRAQQTLQAVQQCGFGILPHLANSADLGPLRLFFFVP